MCDIHVVSITWKDGEMTIKFISQSCGSTNRFNNKARRNARHYIRNIVYLNLKWDINYLNRLIANLPRNIDEGLLHVQKSTLSLQNPCPGTVLLNKLPLSISSGPTGKSIKSGEASTNSVYSNYELLVNASLPGCFSIIMSFTIEMHTVHVVRDGCTYWMNSNIAWC